MYTKITNPVNGNIVSVYSAKGKELIHQYVNFLVGGDTVSSPLTAQPEEMDGTQNNNTLGLEVAVISNLESLRERAWIYQLLTNDAKEEVGAIAELIMPGTMVPSGKPLKMNDDMGEVLRVLRASPEIAGPFLDLDVLHRGPMSDESQYREVFENTTITDDAELTGGATLALGFVVVLVAVGGGVYACVTKGPSASTSYRTLDIKIKKVETVVNAAKRIRDQQRNLGSGLAEHKKRRTLITERRKKVDSIRLVLNLIVAGVALCELTPVEKTTLTKRVDKIKSTLQEIRKRK